MPSPHVFHMLVYLTAVYVDTRIYTRLTSVVIKTIKQNICLSANPKVVFQEVVKSWASCLRAPTRSLVVVNFGNPGEYTFKIWSKLKEKQNYVAIQNKERSGLLDIGRIF